jgi:hypothetical protein
MDGICIRVNIAGICIPINACAALTCLFVHIPLYTFMFVCLYAACRSGVYYDIYVIDSNGLRHMSDGPYKRHEPVVSEARF